MTSWQVESCSEPSWGAPGMDAIRRSMTFWIVLFIASLFFFLPFCLPNSRFHDLRHSAATLLLSLGVHPKVVQELLGHTQISMTMDILCRHLGKMST